MERQLLDEAAGLERLIGEWVGSDVPKSSGRSTGPEWVCTDGGPNSAD